jgi:hypothetical protein
VKNPLFAFWGVLGVIWDLAEKRQKKAKKGEKRAILGSRDGGLEGAILRV